MLLEGLENRLVELVFEDIDKLPAKLKKLGMATTAFDSGESIKLHGIVPTNISVGIDPTTKAVQLGFAFAGDRWASVFPDLLEKVSKKARSTRTAGRP